jgi:hypothetical protein
MRLTPKPENDGPLISTTPRRLAVASGDELTPNPKNIDYEKY